MQAFLSGMWMGLRFCCSRQNIQWEWNEQEESPLPLYTKCRVCVVLHMVRDSSSPATALPSVPHLLRVCVLTEEAHQALQLLGLSLQTSSRKPREEHHLTDSLRTQHRTCHVDPLVARCTVECSQVIKILPGLLLRTPYGTGNLEAK